MGIDNTKLILIFSSDLKILMLKNTVTIHSESHSLDSTDIIDGIIFNITKIERLLTNFIASHNLRTAPTTILLKDSVIKQSLNQDLELNSNIYHLKSYELQFYPQSVFYNLGIKHYQILQYSLLCAKLSISLESITTPLVHLHRLFKASCNKKIPTGITTIESLEMFLKNAIKESKTLDQICNSTKYFDTILTMY